MECKVEHLCKTSQQHELGCLHAVTPRCPNFNVVAVQTSSKIGWNVKSNLTGLPRQQSLIIEIGDKGCACVNLIPTNTHCRCALACAVFDFTYHVRYWCGADASVVLESYTINRRPIVVELTHPAAEGAPTNAVGTRYARGSGNVASRGKAVSTDPETTPTAASAAM